MIVRKSVELTLINKEDEDEEDNEGDEWCSLVDIVEEDVC